eukprot:1157625-Pelagomonas_calceolata.AAC.11
MVQDPPWVYDKAYYKVNFRPKQEGMPAWVPGKIWLQTLMWSSIFPTKSQIRQFEASPAFLDMIYQVRSRNTSLACLVTGML